MVRIGTQSPPATETVSNTGNVTITLTSTVIVGDFLIAGTTCAATLGPLQNCAYSLIVAPKVTGIVTGLFSINNNGSTGLQSVQLTGSGH